MTRIALLVALFLAGCTVYVPPVEVGGGVVVAPGHYHGHRHHDHDDDD